MTGHRTPLRLAALLSLACVLAPSPRAAATEVGWRVGLAGWSSVGSLPDGTIARFDDLLDAELRAMPLLVPVATDTFLADLSAERRAEWAGCLQSDCVPLDSAFAGVQEVLVGRVVVDGPSLTVSLARFDGALPWARRVVTASLPLAAFSPVATGAPVAEGAADPVRDAVQGLARRAFPDFVTPLPGTDGTVGLRGSVMTAPPIPRVVTVGLGALAVVGLGTATYFGIAYAGSTAAYDAANNPPPGQPVDIVKLQAAERRNVFNYRGLLISGIGAVAAGVLGAIAVPLTDWGGAGEIAAEANAPFTLTAVDVGPAGVTLAGTF